MPDALHFTDDADANRLLATNPTALIIGMLLDQQIPMERAFGAPHLLADRIEGPLEPATLAEYDDEEITEIFRGPPALHRFPGSMGKRTRDLCAAIVEDYDGDTARIWREAEDGPNFYRRLRALPGFGEAKARVFVGLVGKRLGEAPAGWEDEAAEWSSIADIEAFDQVAVLREEKRARKAARKQQRDES